MNILPSHMRNAAAITGGFGRFPLAGARAVVLSILYVLALISCLPLSQAARAGQSGASIDQNGAPGAAPRHDISGTWEPANGVGDGIQATGVKAMPADGKPEHQLPYTPLGLATLKSHKALEGIDAVLPGFYNDPRDKCEPIGFPRLDLYNLRQTQILQNEYKVAILYEYGETWRVIWTDGRELPKLVEGGVQVGKEIREPRYYGYSAGHCAVDDTTLCRSPNSWDDGGR